VGQAARGVTARAAVRADKVASEARGVAVDADVAIFKGVHGAFGVTAGLVERVAFCAGEASVVAGQGAVEALGVADGCIRGC